MSDRLFETVAMVVYCLFFASIAWVTRHTSSQWRFVAPILVVVGLVLIFFLTRGYTFSGPGFVVHPPRSSR